MPDKVTPFRGTILKCMDMAGMTGHQWDPWRTFWQAVFALPMNKANRERFAKHAGGREPPSAPVSEVWALVGRRGGKSRNMGIAAGFLAIRRDYRTLLGPGEQAIIPVIAADRKQARQVLNYLKGFCALKAIEPYVGRILTWSVEFTTGVTVEVATASYRTTRGYTIPAILADELAFWRSDDSAEPDTEILDALRGGMLTIPDALLIAGSTPYARKGELYNAHTEHYGKNTPDILVWNADTLSMHAGPRVEKFVAKKFEDDPVVAASEYGTEGAVVFRADVESYIDPEAVEDVTVIGRHELVPARNDNGVLLRTYKAFTDPSGGSQDAWTLAIAHQQDAKAVLDAIRETQPPFSPENVVKDYATVLKSYGIKEVWGDHYGGEFPRELFRKHGITYRVSDSTKSDLYREILPAINAGHVELLEHKRLKAQLCGLERHVARSGQDTIDHAPGGHDDTANAVAGALGLASRKSGATFSHVAI